MVNRISVALIVAGALLTASASQAQNRRDIFANPQNLKVLPKDISSEELSRTMRGFTRQLGLRCSSCHVGEEDQSIFDYDFAADDKELKSVARKMIKMVSTINKTVSKMDRGDDHQFVKVTCVTCHRGQSRPRMIEDVLADAYAKGGVDAAIAKYTELRNQFYGGFSFDFSALRLAEYGRSLAGAAPEDALKVHDLNVQLNPDAGVAYAGRALAYEQLGRLEEALADFEKALALDPDLAFYATHVEELKKQLGQSTSEE